MSTINLNKGIALQTLVLFSPTTIPHTLFSKINLVFGSTNMVTMLCLSKVLLTVPYLNAIKGLSLMHNWGCY